MIVNLDEPILNFEGDPVEQNNSQLTYGKIIRQACTAPREKEDADEKLKRFNIGLKCVADEADLDLDERKMIKDLVDEFQFNPVIYGRICQALEGQEEAAEEPS